MIDLTGLSFAEMQPSLLEFGGIQRPTMGGASQQLNRLGTRFAFALALPPLPSSTAWTATIALAKQQGALIRLPEPAYNGQPTAPASVAAAVAGGVSVQVAGLAPGFQMPSKWVSFVHGGRRYAHLVVSATPAASDGTSAFTVTPMLRTNLAAGDLVELFGVKAQGLLVDKLSWALPKSRLISFTLSLEEQK